MKKKDRIEDFLAVSLLLTFLISLSFYLPGEITGQAVNGSSGAMYFGASISNKTDLKISSFTFKNPMTLYEVQNITVEIHNIGSTDYDAQITETIYNFSNGTSLNQLAVYVDSTVHLYPGNTRTHKTVFVPENLGSYFIKATVHYGLRVKEVWGSFEVIQLNQTPPPPGPPPNQTNQSNQTQPPGGGGGGGGGGGQGGNGTGQIIGTIPPQEPEKLPANISNYSMSVEYPERTNVYRNITNLLNIKVTNTGKNNLVNIIFYASYPDVFEIDVNPKTSQTLQFDESVTYLVSIYTSNASLREYPFDFEAVSQNIKSNGSVILDVKEAPESLKELIREKIINYKILISQISAEIEAASIKGLDVSLPAKFIISANDGLNRTESLYNSGRYEDALTELEKVEEDIKTAVFTLGNLSLRLYAVQRIDYLLFVFLVPVVLFILLLWYRRRQNRRPRLLQRAKEE